MKLTRKPASMVKVYIPGPELVPRIWSSVVCRKRVAGNVWLCEDHGAGGGGFGSYAR